ncbi:hypothetical protein ACLO87_09630 [Paenalcaligenes sp. Me52]|uniref:hypothetical protein n=1 Tax=Paenalcaligenes sp. Me52 TaxID=3392038 RepID=UPI003D278158
MTHYKAVVLWVAVKDNKPSTTIGYCVNYDVNRVENARPTSQDATGNVQEHFIYVAKDKPVSATTANADFVKRMCGEDFFNRYKKPNPSTPASLI